MIQVFKLCKENPLSFRPAEDSQSPLGQTGRIGRDNRNEADNQVKDLKVGKGEGGASANDSKKAINITTVDLSEEIVIPSDQGQS